MKRSKAWGLWYGMRYRCSEKAQGNILKNYYLRGIRVCPEWQDNFESFFTWAAKGYQEGLQIDRKDNNGPYAPENCQWVTHQVNSQKRQTSKLTPWGAMHITCLHQHFGFLQKDIAENLHLHNGTVSKILNKKRWSNVGGGYLCQT